MPTCPSRIFGPCATTATSRTRTGVPPCAFTTVAPMSAVSRINPTARMLNACWPCSMKLPPALTLLAASACSTCARLSP